MQNNPRWRELCAQAAVEQDPKKLLELVAEISRLFDEEHNRIREGPDENQPEDTGSHAE